MILSSPEINLLLLRTQEEVEEQKLITTYFFDIQLVSTQEYVGKIDLRVGMSSDLFYYGNIGYTVYKPYRGNRYAYKACCMVFKLAQRLKMKEIIITCNPDNVPSYKTCQRLYPDSIDLVDVPRKHDLYRYGEHQKYIFRYQLKGLEKND